MHEHATAALDDARALMTGLEADFPGWRVWRTTGSWWATRRGPQWMREPRTLAADTADGLRKELHDTRDAAAAGC